MKRVTQICQHVIGILGGAAVVAGCSIPGDVEVRTSAPRARAMLAAARANQISLFGDLPGAGESTYFSRSAVPLKQHSFTEVGADFDADVDATGTRIVFASTRHNVHPNLYIKSVDGVAVTQLTSDAASDVQPAFSPDGTRVAFASNRSGQWDIWVIDVQGGPPVQVTTGPVDKVHPSWSPDGGRLVYCARPSSGQWELWVVDAAAGSTRRFIGYGLFPEWSPVSDTMVYQRARERGSRWFSIWTLTLVGGEPRYPTELAASSTEAMILPTWSPDGRQVAFASVVTWAPAADGLGLPATSGVFDIWVMNADGRAKRRLTDGYTVNYAPTFSPDGRIYFASGRSGRENIWSLGPARATGANPDGNHLTRGTGDAETGGEKTARTAAAEDGL